MTMMCINNGAFFDPLLSRPVTKWLERRTAGTSTRTDGFLFPAEVERVEVVITPPNKIERR